MSEEDSTRTVWRNRLMTREGTSRTNVNVDVRRKNAGCTGWYMLGFIGSLWYYVSHGSVIAGIGKALVWPAFLVYHLLSLKG